MGKKVLIVDDDYAFSSFAKRLLEDNGMEAITASNGKDGLLMAEKEHPSLILLDIGMPGMNGYEVLELIKKTAETAQIPVILCSITKGPRDVEEGMSLGAAGFIPKPLNPKDSISKIKAILSGQGGNGNLG
ncbi:MAG: response regulator [Elusimicrobia bacterium]|nr:response regulator [Elusimicrobiota bacterium]